VPVAIPQGDNSAALADWVEMAVATRAGGVMSFGRIARLLNCEASELAEQELREDAEREGLPSDDEGGAEIEVDLAELGAEAEAERDERLDLLKDEVDRRAELGPGVYPFQVEEGRIKQVEACGEDAYFLLLVLSSRHASYRGERRAHEAEAAFDRVALEAMKRYLGRGADGVRFARTSEDLEDEKTRPKRFSEAIEWLRDKLDARSGTKQPDDAEYEEPHWESPAPLLNTYKDAGVDLVVWAGFGDGRPGFPVVLVQCTVQESWQDKLEEISLRLWQRWINFSMVPPQTALVIPFSEDL
jgi:hypothetical protein